MEDSPPQLGCHISEMTTLLVLQVVLDRLIKQMIVMKRGENQGTSMQSPPVEMSEREIAPLLDAHSHRLCYIA